MRKLLTLMMTLIVAISFAHCTAKPKDKAETMTQQPATLPTKYDSVLTKEQLKDMGIDWNTLKKHLTLQDRAWYGGDFRDDQSKPRYMPTREDFDLTIPLVEYYLQTHGYQKPSEEVFLRQIQQVYGKKISLQSRAYQPLWSDNDYDFASNYFALCSSRIITFNWLLNDMVSIKGNKVVLDPCFFKQILALNNFVFYGKVTAFNYLKHMNANSFSNNYGGIGDIYGGQEMLQDLFYKDNYYGNAMLNQWVFKSNEESALGFFQRIFVKSATNKLVVHLPLIETIERNTTGNDHDYYDHHFALYVMELLRDNKNNVYHFNLEQKARIFCYFANSEYRIRNRYKDFMMPDDPDASWDQTAWTSVMMEDCKEIYNTARANNFYGICKPNMLKEMAEKWGVREYN